MAAQIVMFITFAVVLEKKERSIVHGSKQGLSKLTKNKT